MPNNGFWGVGMITLSEAFRLCNVGNEPVYLIHVNELKSVWSPDCYFYSRKIRDRFDMKKVKVVKIDLKFESFGSDFIGWRFVVSGITPEELHKESLI